MLGSLRLGLQSVLLAAAFTMVASTAPAAAQSSSRTPILTAADADLAPLPEIYDPASLEDVRDHWLETLNLVHNLPEVQENAIARQNTFDAMARISTASNEELEKFRRAGIDPRKLGRAVNDLRKRVEELQAQRMSGAPVMGSSALVTSFPSADYSSFCGTMRSDTVLNWTARTLLNVAKTAWSAAGRVCEEVVLGFNTSLVCIAADVLLFVAEILYDKVEFCDADIDSSEIRASYLRLGAVNKGIEAVKTAQGGQDMKLDQIRVDISTSRTLIINNDNSNKAMVVDNDNSNRTTIINNDNSNKDMIVTNDNSNRDTIINNDNANRVLIINNDNANTLTIVNLNLQLAIEEDLKKSDFPIVSFLLPEAQGGHILRVSQIVSNSMTRVNNVGIPTPTAQIYFGLAEAERTQGHYHQAYNFYRIAYQAVSRP